MTRITGTLHGNQYTFLIIAHSFLIIMRNGSDKSCRKKKEKSNNFLFENPAVREIMWKKYCRAEQATDDNMAHASCMLDT